MSTEEKVVNEPQEEKQEKEEQAEEDPNTLTEEDKQVYQQILSSITRMNKKIKDAKDKVPEQQKDMNKRNQVNEIAAKLIESKEKSDIITKGDLKSDVNQTFEEVIVDVYSQNKLLQKKIESLVAIIKEQNRKINYHKDKQENLKIQNQKLREEIITMKDEHMMVSRQPQQNRPVVPQKNKSKTLADNQSDDYDFWTMPQNENPKKRKDFVQDSNLWVNEKDINESVFVTDQSVKRR